MAGDALNVFNFTFTARNAPRNGPMSSDAWNDTMYELANDLANINIEWQKVIAVFSALPDGEYDTEINVFTNGLDGRNLWTDSTVEGTSDDLTFWNGVKNRPNTVKEQFDNVYNTLTIELEQVRSDVSNMAVGLTTDQKNRIGANIFDNTVSSSASSLDGKSERNRKNILQLANDLYGPTASLQHTGNGILDQASVYDMLGAVLAIHNSSWNSGTLPDHAGVFTAIQENVNSSHPGDDSYTGNPVNLRQDLDRIRNAIVNLKGTPSWLSLHTALYAGGATTLEALFTSTAGSSTKTATNPWGYRYDNITGLNDRLEAIRLFTGQNSQLNDSPQYSSNNFVTDGESLVAAISELDDKLFARTSGVVDVSAYVSALSKFTGQWPDQIDELPSYLSTAFVVDGSDLQAAISTLDAALAVHADILEVFSGEVYGDISDQIEALSGQMSQEILQLSGEIAALDFDLQVHNHSFINLDDVSVSTFDGHAFKLFRVDGDEVSVQMSEARVTPGGDLWCQDVLCNDVVASGNITVTSGVNIDGSVDIGGTLEVGSDITSLGGDIITDQGDVEVVHSGYGLILKSPNGTRWRISVDNSGVLYTTAL